MAKFARKRFHVEDGQRARFFEVGEEVPEEFEGRYDPALVGDSADLDELNQGQEVDGSDVDGVGVLVPALSADELADFEGLKTIEQIVTWVQMGDPDPNLVARAEHALQVEKEGGQRKGLLEALEGILADQNRVADEDQGDGGS